jgi:glutamine cyclotransferase
MREFLTVILLSFVLLSCSDAKVKEYKLDVLAEYPHDVTSYTQGLFFHDGQMYESTGQFGESTFRKVDMVSGEALERLDFSDEYFVEGSVMFADNLYILTWTNRKAFIYDAATLKYKSTWSYPREGWGITTDGKRLIASDGSANLYFMDKNFAPEKKITVTLEGRPVRFLNELEYIDGKIWANVYTTDTIVIINPKDGKVEGLIDCTGLLPKKLRKPSTDVLNGIAHDSRNGKIYLTGKNWPKLYEIGLIEKK